METQLTQEQIDDLIDAINRVAECIKKAVAEFMEIVRQIAIQLSRFILEWRLAEWNIPGRAAKFIAKNIHWRLALKWGLGWWAAKVSM